VKGIYLISDVKTGKRYIGSAYGDQGIWSRWCDYVASGHGGNVELCALVSEPTLEYCRKSFGFALLEYRPSPTPDDVILARGKASRCRSRLLGRVASRYRPAAILR
jgi:hypothetical protein